MAKPDRDQSKPRFAIERLIELGRRLAMGAARTVDALPPLQRGAVFVVLLGLLGVQLAGIVQLGRSGAITRQASPPTGTRTEPGLTSGTFAIVSFSAGALVGAVASLLEAHGVEIVEGPKAGIWRVRLSRALLDDAATQARLDALKGDGGVIVFAAPAL